MRLEEYRSVQSSVRCRSARVCEDEDGDECVGECVVSVLSGCTVVVVWDKGERTYHCQPKSSFVRVVVDRRSNAVYALLSDKVLYRWGLDEDVSGPHDGASSVRVEGDVLSMAPLAEDGVAGLLTNGNAFVARSANGLFAISHVAALGLPPTRAKLLSLSLTTSLAKRKRDAADDIVTLVSFQQTASHESLALRVTRHSVNLSQSSCAARHIPIVLSDRHRHPTVWAKASLLDRGHAALLTRSADYRCAVLDIHSGALTAPFTLSFLRTDEPLKALGAVSSSVIAILTSTNQIMLLHVYHAVLLHTTTPCRLDNIIQMNTSTTGSLALVSNHKNTTIAFWRLTNTHQPANNTLSSIIASSLAADVVKTMLLATKPPTKVVQKDWRLLIGDHHSDNNSDESPLSAALDILSSFRTNSSHDISFLSFFLDGVKILQPSQQQQQQQQQQEGNNGQHNGICHSREEGHGVDTDDGGMSHLPQLFLDEAFGIALDIILEQYRRKRSNTTTSVILMEDAMNVIMSCLQSGKISPRFHFDSPLRTILVPNQDVLYATLLALRTITSNTNNKEEEKNDYSLELIHQLLITTTTLTEQMLVTMIHYLICHVTHLELECHYNNFKKKNHYWYYDSKLKQVERLYKGTKHKISKLQTTITTTNNEVEHQQQTLRSNERLNSISNQLVVIRKSSWIGKIVTYTNSKTCNSSLLCFAMCDGLRYPEEIKIILQILTNLLRQGNTTGGVLQWITALIDSHLMNRQHQHDTDNDTTMEWKKLTLAVEATRKQAVVLTKLQDLINAASSVYSDSNGDDDKTKNMDSFFFPLHGETKQQQSIDNHHRHPPPSSYTIECLTF